jgi:HEAT repeat protein
MRKTLGMNKHQKAVYRVGEPQVGREEIQELLEQSRSGDAEERLVAAQFLCPCHVRRRIEPVWEALYRLLEDPDVRVRRAAWHTLEDGGRPDDPALDVILERALKNETDPQVLRFAQHLAGPRRQQELVAARAMGRPAPPQRGRCDFCGEREVEVQRDLETMIPTDELPRAAWICAGCAKSG